MSDEDLRGFARDPRNYRRHLQEGDLEDAADATPQKEIDAAVPAPATEPPPKAGQNTARRQLRTGH